MKKFFVITDFIIWIAGLVIFIQALAFTKNLFMLTAGGFLILIPSINGLFREMMEEFKSIKKILQ